MDHYKSWSGLKKTLEASLCGSLRGRVTYFLTRYHEVHDAYGRASVRVDGTEWVCFTWFDMYRQESDLHEQWKAGGKWDWDDPVLTEKWNRDAVLSDMDFLDAAVRFTGMPVSEALNSGEGILQILAVMDRRVGKRTLLKLRDGGRMDALPSWVRRFFQLRFEAEGLPLGNDGTHPE